MTVKDVAIIGSGFSGLGMAIRLKQSGIENFVLLEKGADVGGTWCVNTYPGCACDVQSHLYSFSFEPNPNWSRMFATQPEIWEYLKGCAARHALYPKIRFNTELRRAQWDPDAALWTLSGNDGVIVRARALVTALGGLSRPAYPDVPGLEHFEGKAFHSQQWDHDYALKGKRVAVVGTGASAIQFVPQIAPKVARLDLYQRTPPWILPKPDREIPASERRLYRMFPQVQRVLRQALYWQLEARAAGFVINPRLMALPERWARAHIRQQIPDRRLRRQVTPDYAVGCKRVLISNDYYPALMRGNVYLQTGGVERITPQGVIGADGRERTVDAIIFGTGFQATDPVGPLEILGRGGLDLRQHFRANGTQAYLGATVNGFPNLFMLTGPNTGVGHQSLVYMIEAQIEYVLQAVQTLRQRQLPAIEVRANVQQRFNEGMRSRLEGAVWSQGGCRSWYLDEHGRNVTLWPDFTWRFARAVSRFRLSDYRQLDRSQPQADAPSVAA